MSDENDKQTEPVVPILELMRAIERNAEIHHDSDGIAESGMCIREKYLLEIIEKYAGINWHFAKSSVSISFSDDERYVLMPNKLTREMAYAMMIAHDSGKTNAEVYQAMIEASSL